MSSAYDVRRYEDADWPAVLELLRLSLGWRDGDPNEALFQWKHRDNPFGPSPAWVAVQGSQIIGFRTFMRWEFEDAGRVVRAVRAVDTATHPEHQGRGIFKRLTLHAADELRDEGVEFVFNTPNDQSRPGYLKMGWQVVGRLPTRVRPRTPASVGAMLRARVPADLLSRATDVGEDAAQVFAGEATAAPSGAVGLATRRSQDYLRWRYGLPALGYRVWRHGDGEAAVVFRLRRRGPAMEAVLCDVITAAPAARSVAALLRATQVDYAISLGPARGTVPLPRQGPLLTYRPLARDLPEPPRLRLTLGDVELF